jgi:cation:H+ antiporter
LVDSAVRIAVAAAVPQAVIGLTLVAIGTSVPEIATCIAAFRKDHGDVALGDVIGANILNLLWIIGAAATAHPIAVGKTVLMVAFPSMILVILVKVVFVYLGGSFPRWKGAVLVGLYAGYTILTLTVTGAPEAVGRLPSLVVP